MLCLLTVNSIPTRRSELTSKEVQWQQRQESFEKKISEDSLEKGKISNSSQRKTPNADKEKITKKKKKRSPRDKEEMYIHYCSAYIIVSYIVLTTYFINIIKD